MANRRPSSEDHQAPTTLLEWALSYARDFGWHVLPLIEQGKKPHPCLGKGGGFHHATTDPEQIEKWWTKYPDANVGIACRKSGLIVPDIDSSNGKRGEITWARLVQKHGVPPETVEAVTGSGGRHLVYTVDHDVTPSSLGDHIDLKYNGYIVAPPSIHPDTGRPYRWKDGASPYDREAEGSPTWLLNGSGRESTIVDNENWLDKVRSTEKGRVLFDEGDISRYEDDHSDADFALLNILTAAIGPSPKRVKDAFKRSALWKLDTRSANHRREDYVDLSIDGVFDRFRNPPDKPHRRPAPTALGQDALYGLVGDWVSLVEEHTEASTAALVAQFLTAVGSALGRGPRFKVEADWHHTNLFAAIVGRTAKARKGTSFGRSVEAIRMADENWNERVHSGISTAEGLVRLLRASKNAVDSTTDENEFKSITDDRLLVYEPEFAALLRRARRGDNIIGQVLRDLWDRGDVAIRRAQDPVFVTDVHLSVIVHITEQELSEELTTVDMANGFGNRFMWFYVERSKLLPEGGSLAAEALEPTAARIKAAIEFAASLENVPFDSEAKEYWNSVGYKQLEEDVPGLLGLLTSRSSPIVRRLALIYAMLDLSNVVRMDHLRAALAVWAYSEQSAAHLFGASLGNPTADKILSYLLQHPSGVTRKELNVDLFSRNVKSDVIDGALELLKERNLVYFMKVAPKGGKGRPTEVWFATVIQNP